MKHHKKQEKFMNKRPYVICLMMTSVDGKILSDKWGNNPRVKSLLRHFENAHDKFDVRAWLVGRTTMEKDFTKGLKPILREGEGEKSRADFVADKKAKSFAIAVDSKGKLGWKKPKMMGDHVITILTEEVPDGYLAHLKDIGVSYIFAGKKEIDLKVALEKLYALFGIRKLMLEGGGRINGSFLSEGLIDEYHQLVLPIADGTIETSSVFEIAPDVNKGGATLLKLKRIKKIKNGVVWLTYKIGR
ncbi:MAG TPA: RibD family protein [Puia sp.]|nr:RibD family protein [Puia sp.]